MNGIRRFGHFWYDFVVGDDWRLALGAVLALGLTGIAAHRGAAAWWIAPVVVVSVLVVTLVRAKPRT